MFALGLAGLERPARAVDRDTIDALGRLARSGARLPADGEARRGSKHRRAKEAGKKRARERRRARRRARTTPVAEAAPPAAAVDPAAPGDQPEPAAPGDQPEPAPEPEPEPEAAEAIEPAEPLVAETVRPSAIDAQLRGLARSRVRVVREDEAALLSGMMPSAGQGPVAYTEIALQPRVGIAGKRLGATADVGAYLGTDAPTQLYLINELYVDSTPTPGLYVAAGRKRVIWGSGIAANPTDVLNPRQDPLDLGLQRMGALMAPMVELTTPEFTLSAALSPRVDTDEHALPRDVDFERSVAVVRAYRLVAGTDVNLIYAGDVEHSRHAAGLSLSRYFGDHVELHAEAMAGPGEPELPPLPWHPACGTPLSPAQSWTGAAVVGGRVDRSDQTFVAVEYLFLGGGLDRDGWNQVRDQAGCVKTQLAGMPPPPPPDPTDASDPLLVLLRRHYVVVNAQRPHLTPSRFEDVSIGATIIASAEDLALITKGTIGLQLWQHASVQIAAIGWFGRAGSEVAEAPLRAAGSIDFTLRR